MVPAGCDIDRLATALESLAVAVDGLACVLEEGRAMPGVEVVLSALDELAGMLTRRGAA
jgi:hypothetical protein